MNIEIRNGRVIDPANNLDMVTTLFISNGRIAALGQAPAGFKADQTIDATHRLVVPGLVDLQARMREPGLEHKGTIASETRAAAAGGITTLCCPPDTDPVLDTESVAEQMRQRAHSAGFARVIPIGALTAGLKGEQLAEMQTLKDAGCVAMSNARQPILNTLVLRRALEYASTLGLTVVLHPEDPYLASNGCIHEGMVSTRLGLPGIPECAEVIAISRDLRLIEQTGVRAHFATLSSARAVEMVAEARARGVPVTADVSMQQLFLTEMDVNYFNSLCHVRPPFRTQRDREGIRAAVADGVIGAICSDHQPHDVDAKLAPFAATEPGSSGLETLLPLALRLTAEKVLSLSQAIACVTCEPARIFGIDAGTLSVGARADLCIVDPQARWTVSEKTLISRGKNSPFLGWELHGKATHTLLEGRIVHESCA